MRWKQLTDADGVKLSAYEVRPEDNWRCRVRLNQNTGVWDWDAVRFGRSPLHVSGECDRFDHSKRVAVAAVRAIRSSGR